VAEGSEDVARVGGAARTPFFIV